MFIIYSLQFQNFRTSFYASYTFKISCTLSFFSLSYYPINIWFNKILMSLCPVLAFIFYLVLVMYHFLNLGTYFLCFSWPAAECFPDRTDVQCLHRWQKVLNPDLVKGPWSKEVQYFVDQHDKIYFCSLKFSVGLNRLIYSYFSLS